MYSCCCCVHHFLLVWWRITLRFIVILVILSCCSCTEYLTAGLPLKIPLWLSFLWNTICILYTLCTYLWMDLTYLWQIASSSCFPYFLMLCESTAEIEELSLFFDLSSALWILKNQGRKRKSMLYCFFSRFWEVGLTDALKILKVIVDRHWKYRSQAVKADLGTTLTRVLWLRLYSHILPSVLDS